MKRRWLIRLLVLAILAAFIVWLEPTRVVWGWLRGEVFYQGRPTSYWARVIASWRLDEKLLCHNERIYRSCEFQEPPRWLTAIIKLPDPEIPAVLGARPDTRDMLRELTNHADPNVAALARTALDHLNDPEKAPPLVFVQRR
jgi:hypothetical protein